MTPSGNTRPPSDSGPDAALLAPQLREQHGHTKAASRAVITVTGVVQGVGFRPFVWQQAQQLSLSGEVINNTDGVRIDVEGAPDAIEGLLQALRREPPPRAAITSIGVAFATPLGREAFQIGASSLPGRGRQLVAADSCTCDRCLRELFDPADRRYRYPFINCTDCGPRFTIIEALPYDRPLTTMKSFEMCPQCRREYEDPGDRRFHAEPNACPECGPQLWLAGPEGSRLGCDDAIQAATDALLSGRVVALKGLGGFQLACLATDEAAVDLLRRRKRRAHKPFAVMVGSELDACHYCDASPEELELLAAVERPIVLMRQRPGTLLAEGVAPRLGQVGLMLPCAPLHFLLMRSVQAPLVMTSGNAAEEPICRTNAEAIARLGGIADLFLLHNRGIRSTYDDSVMMVEDGRPVMIRRARGYAPLPLPLPDGPPLLAAGGELKSNFCLARGSEAFVSQHIGDLENADTLLHYEATEALYEQLLDCEPRQFACDRHPDYLSSAWCLERDPAPLRMQHHRAHIASCLAENDCADAVVGVALDGTGLGDDGAIWGGEFFTGSLARGFERAARLDYFPLLGGEAAIHEPWRTALALVWKYAPDRIDYAAELLQVPLGKKGLLVRQLDTGLNCPATSSCGRLFDGVAALALQRVAISFEAQAAMELEAAAAAASLQETKDKSLSSLSYRFSLNFNVTPWVLSPRRGIARLLDDIRNGAPAGAIAHRFHLGLSDSIVRTCARLAALHDTGTVALSGGVFQNRLLTGLVRQGLQCEGLRVLTQHRLPPNDGGLSYGQAVLARHSHLKEE